MLCFQQCYLIAGALRRCEKSARERKTDAPVAAHQLCVRLHISAAATGNAGLGVAAVVTAALGHIKDLPRVRALH